MFELSGETPYDVKFELLRIPVRVQPMFWLVTACMGWDGRNPQNTLIWVACVLVSILVHEFGHGLMSRRFGGRPSIILHSMGGVCTSQGWESVIERMAVILAGPGAGLALFLLVLTGCNLVVGMTPTDALALVGWGSMDQLDIARNRLFSLRSPLIVPAIYDLIYINLYWSLFNLLPIYPLDGGQFLGVVLSKRYRQEATRWMHTVGLLVAGGLAIYLFGTDRYRYEAFFCGLLAFHNYQLLQAVTGKGFERWN